MTTRKRPARSVPGAGARPSSTRILVYIDVPAEGPLTRDLCDAAVARAGAALRQALAVEAAKR